MSKRKQPDLPSYNGPRHPDHIALSQMLRSLSGNDVAGIMLDFLDTTSSRCSLCQLALPQYHDTCDECESDFHPACSGSDYFCAECVHKDLDVCFYCDGKCGHSVSFQCAECDAWFHNDCDDAVPATNGSSVCNPCYLDSLDLCDTCDEPLDDRAHDVSTCPRCENKTHVECLKEPFGCCNECDAVVRDRHGTLTACLAEWALVIRPDSKLCHQFIMEQVDKNVYEVRLHIARARLFHEYCNWSLFWAIAERENAEAWKAGYFPDCSTYDLTEDYLRQLSNDWKNYAWPWLHGVSISEFRQTEPYLALENSFKKNL